mgnify:CR=1 FL=1
MFDKAKKQQEQPKENESTKEVKKEPSKEELLEEGLKRAKEEAEAWKNKYYMAFADTQNLRKSLEEDHREALRYRAEGFLESLLPALDSFHMALEATPNSKEALNYQQGFNFIYKQILASLESEGVSELSPKVGDLFDPSFMHAIDVAPYEEGKDGKVAKVYAKGYKLHDHIVSPAKVVVFAKKKEETKDEIKDGNKEETKEAEHKA